MKNKIIIGICMLIISGVMLFAISINNEQKENENYSMIEFVSSMKDINRELPTIIFFKSVAVPVSLDAEVNLKNLKEEFNSSFNLVHVSLDDLSNKETQQLIEDYGVNHAPTIVSLDKNGNTVEIKSLIVSENGIREILKGIGIE